MKTLSIALLVAGCCVTGCLHTQSHKGTADSMKNVATLITGKNVRIDQIDGKEVSVLEGVDFQKLETTPGLHTLSLTYLNRLENGKIAKSDKPKHLTLELENGGTYKVLGQFKIMRNEEKTTGWSWDVWVEDNNTGEVVAGVKPSS